MRNAAAYVPKAQQSMVSAALRQAFVQTTKLNRRHIAASRQALASRAIHPHQISQH